MAKVITKAQRSSAIINVLKVAKPESDWENVLIVTEKDGRKHETICNGYMMVTLNEGEYFDVERVTVKNIDFNKDDSLEKIIGINEQLQEIKIVTIDDVTNKIPTLADMQSIFKTTNKRSKFIKTNFNLKDSNGKLYVPIVFRDSKGILHEFNGNYIFWSLLLVCNSFQADYSIKVENAQIGRITIEGDLGCAVVMPVRINIHQNSPDRMLMAINEGYDRVEYFKNRVIDMVKHIVKSEGKYNQLVFNNTVEFYLNEFVSEQQLAFNDDVTTDEMFNECVKILRTMYTKVFETYTKGCQIFKDKLHIEKDNKWWESKIKESFVTHLCNNYMSIGENQSMFCTLAHIPKGDEIKLIGKYYKPIKTA